MIINVRGTGGAGKSTIVREVMRRYSGRRAFYREGRRQPYGYVCSRQEGRRLWVVGHYETACGGADTIKTPDEVYASVGTAAADGMDVIFEGIITQDDVRRCAEMARAHEVRVIGLRVPIDDCLAGIRARRADRGDSRPLNPTNTINRAQTLERTMQRLCDAGVDAQWLGRDEARARVLDMLGLGEPAAAAEPLEFELR